MYFEFFSYPFLFVLAILIPLLIVRWRRTHSASHLFFFAIFWIYLTILASMTIFPIRYAGFEGWFKEPVSQILARINLVPFDFGRLFELSPRIIFDNLAGNVLLTMPFGFGVSFVSQVSFKRALWLSLAVGLGLETAQLAISLIIGGYRSVDINDSLLNAAGVLVGYGLFRMFSWVYLALIKKLGIRPKGIFAYVFEVAGPKAFIEDERK